MLLDAAQIIISGNISANGADGAAGSEADKASGGGGGGSGGTTTIRGYDINLSYATLSAKGGDGGDGGNQAGGGPHKASGGGGGGNDRDTQELTEMTVHLTKMKPHTSPQSHIILPVTTSPVSLTQEIQLHAMTTSRGTVIPRIIRL